MSHGLPYLCILNFLKIPRGAFTREHFHRVQVRLGGKRAKFQLNVTLPANSNQPPRWEPPWRRRSSTSTRTVVVPSPHRAFQQASGKWVCFRNFHRGRWTRCVLCVQREMQPRSATRDNYCLCALSARLFASPLPGESRYPVPNTVLFADLKKNIYTYQVVSSFGGDGDDAVSLPKFLCFLGKEYGRGASGKRGEAVGGTRGGRSLAGRLRLILKKVQYGVFYMPLLSFMK